MSKLISIQTVMQRFDIKARSTVYEWMKKGYIPPPKKKWGSPRWDEAEIEESITKLIIINPDRE